MEVNLHPKQSEIFRNPARHKIIRCGRRFGKTYYAVTKLIYEAMKNSKTTYWFVAPYYRQAKQIAWKMLNEMMPSGAVVSTHEQELTLKLLNGSEIQLKGADNPDSLKGVGLDGVICDEAAFMRPLVWQEILRPMLFDSGGWSDHISTPQGYNHFYDMWVAAGELKDWERFHFTTYDNPHISAEEVDDSKRTMSDQRFQQEVMAEFTKKTGAVWPELSRDHHLVPRRDVSKNSALFGSIDFGFATGHPTCVQWHEVTADTIFTFDGFMQERLTIEQIDKLMRDQTRGLIIRGLYPDPARPDLIEELRRKGWSIMDTSKDVELGIAKVAEQLRTNPQTNKPGWTMANHLEDQYRQLEEYAWTEIRGDDGRFRQIPKKEKDDACDALRYFIYSHTKPDKSFDKQLSKMQALAEAGEL